MILKAEVEPAEEMSTPSREQHDGEYDKSLMDLVGDLEWLYRQNLTKIHWGQQPF